MSSPRCPVCEGTSTRALLDRPDREYGVPDRVDHHRCTACGLVFVSPMPSGERIGSFYVDYSTHGTPTARRPGVLARWARRTTLREFEAAAPADRTEPVLDYGCGDGSFLAELSAAGHTRLVGYDFDPAAREAARASGATIAESDADLPGLGPFATITLNHVIEHVQDPAGDLRRLGGMLRPGGRLVLRTPNARSVLCRVLGDDWRGWETPRHLHVFTPRSVRALRRSLEPELSLVRVTTSQAMYLGIFHESLHGAVWRGRAGKLARHGLALMSLVLLSAVNRVAPVGEELVVVLERR